MPIETINPAGVFAPSNYSQVAVGKGARTIFLSGQVALDEHGNLVGPGDLEAQTEQAYLNVGTALRAVGANFQDIAKLTVYVVNWTPDKMDSLVAGATRTAERIGFDARRAITLVGVESLASPDFLIEVEAVAMLD